MVIGPGGDSNEGLINVAMEVTSNKLEVEMFRGRHGEVDGGGARSYYLHDKMLVECLGIPALTPEVEHTRDEAEIFVIALIERHSVSLRSLTTLSVLVRVFLL